MERLIEEIVQKLHSLPEVKIIEVLNFVDFLAANKEQLDSHRLEDDSLQTDAEFEATADRLADEFQMCVGANIPALSDYAVSRAGIYEEHP